MWQSVFPVVTQGLGSFHMVAPSHPRALGSDTPSTSRWLRERVEDHVPLARESNYTAPATLTARKAGLGRPVWQWGRNVSTVICQSLPMADF